MSKRPHEVMAGLHQAGQAGNPAAKGARLEPAAAGLDGVAIAAMARICNESIRRFRQSDWTTYARTEHHLLTHNFGIGPEPAIKCFGCRRLLPPCLITGDHIKPKSDLAGLRQSIAFELDNLEPNLYQRALNMNLTTHRQSELGAHLRAIRSYDQTLPQDLRNIQPLCWSCNSRKGNRLNVRLYPAHAHLPIRPNEAPF